MKKAVIVSGYFNPLHKGHLEYFQKAKEQGDLLWVIVNNDVQRALKGSKEFQSENERLAIVQALRVVDLAIISTDKDRTVRKTLRHLKSMFGLEYDMYFANGGDQTNNSIPEVDTCNEVGIKLIDGLGEKIQSSSWLLSK